MKKADKKLGFAEKLRKDERLIALWDTMLIRNLNELERAMVQQIFSETITEYFGSK